MTHTGTILNYRLDRGWGFLRSTNFPSNIFFHVSNCHLPPGSVPQIGETVIFDTDVDRQMRPRAINIRFPGRALAPDHPPVFNGLSDAKRRPAPVDPAQQYEDRALSARRRVRERAEWLWTHGGADEV
jgi:cold shock CspA family protein